MYDDHIAAVNVWSGLTSPDNIPESQQFTGVLLGLDVPEKIKDI